MGVHWARTTCLDITTFGARRGIFGPHSAIWLQWVHERRIRREPVVVTENGPLWPLAETERALGDLYEVLYEKAEQAEALGARSNNPDLAFKGRILLQVDKEMPYSVLRSVMYTAGQAKFGEFKFVVYKQE